MDTRPCVSLLSATVPDDVSSVDLDGPGAPQVVVIGEGIPGGQDATCRLTLETPTALRCTHKHMYVCMHTHTTHTHTHAHTHTRTRTHTRIDRIVY